MNAEPWPLPGGGSTQNASQTRACVVYNASGILPARKMLLHPYQVFRAVYYGLRWRLKRLLQLPDRPRNPVVDGDAEAAFARHLRICQLVKEAIENIAPENRGSACEIGSGDCLAVADLLLGAGFQHVFLVEKQQVVVDARQVSLLQRLAARDDLPNKLGVLAGGAINQEKVTVVPEFFESANLPFKADFIFSHDVIEHVEDLDGFFQGCAGILNPTGKMVHKFDLSGHEFFEDPLPPLDFQTYPNWLYKLMFPKYRRACRRFLDEVIQAADSSGFRQSHIDLIRCADSRYMKELRPRLRFEARSRSAEQLSPLDVLVSFRHSKNK